MPKGYWIATVDAFNPEGMMKYCKGSRAALKRYRAKLSCGMASKNLKLSKVFLS
jgi:uncharacterized protein (DUF1330 family)